MNKAKIFLIDQEGKDIKEMLETAYSTEDVLQRLLALKPGLLPGDQINPDNPREWLLVKREMGIPDEAKKADRWSIDHLFLDQDGVPTFVECKRASDSRIRREVVAQMLEYAANSTAYWTVDHLRQAAATSEREVGSSLADILERLIGSKDEAKIETYWKLVESNLKAGKVRLIFVADEIPTELRRLVEYLNERLLDVDVLAVEVKQFMGDGVRAVVPRLIGMTQKAIDVKSDGIRRTALSLDEFLSQCSPDAADMFRNALNSTLTKDFSVYWGATSFSIRAPIATEEREYASFLYGWTPNTLEIFLKNLPFEETELMSFRQELLKFGIFKEAGNWTLRATIDSQTKQKAEEVYNFALSKVMERLKINRSRIPAQDHLNARVAD
jgi:hypothetical protein